MKHQLLLRKRRSALEKAFNSGLPRELRPVLSHLALGKSDADALGVSAHAESRRLQIASQGQKKVPIWYSPKPGSAGTDADPEATPEPGEVKEFTLERIAKTGKDQRWGSALYLLGKGFRIEYGIELGACAGISALYLSSIPTLKQLTTVEGSEALAEIAKESLRKRQNVEVLNMLFDEAIDLKQATLTHPLDFAYIDGHHEKVATLHYFNKLAPMLKPGALVVFDDVSWSYDMREAWDSLSERKEFSHTIDLGEIGICLMKDSAAASDSLPRKWDLQPITGRRPIGDPHGWKTA